MFIRSTQWGQEYMSIIYQETCLNSVFSWIIAGNSNQTFQYLIAIYLYEPNTVILAVIRNDHRC